MANNLWRLIRGAARSPTEPGVFHKLSLVAFLAWVGLGADGISSACYGPEELFKALVTKDPVTGQVVPHYYLGLILAALTALTVFVISASYKQIIELFPGGGGGYLVASKLLSPGLGMVSGCALVVDYVLTITISIAAGSDAIFSLLPVRFLGLKLGVALVVLLILMLLNLRGVRESVVPIVPVFLAFLITHFFVISYGIASHALEIPVMVNETVQEVQRSVSDPSIGLLGLLWLILHAYSMGGGTYTGIEAVSNGLPILREPRVETGKRTMLYMAVSLAILASGLIVVYLLYRVQPVTGKTLNAVLFARATETWPVGGGTFVFLALLSEAMILVVAAQTGFLDGPRVLSNMAIDGWMPKRFALLSDRLVTQNGILLMGGASAALLWLTGGNVGLLVVLYSINVFLTFTLSQLGMVRHWWQVRHQGQRWFHGLAVNGVGLTMTAFVLVAIVYIKFAEGGWVTLVITSSLVVVAVLIRRHYNHTRKLLQRVDALFRVNRPLQARPIPGVEAVPSDLVLEGNDQNTAVILVSGYNGMGLHTLFTVLRIFKEHFRQFVFLEVAQIDVGQFKGIQEINNLKEKVAQDLSRYVDLARSQGYYAESRFSVGTDVAAEAEKMALETVKKFPQVVVFAGQLVFPSETFFTRLLHNYTAFTIQKRLYYQGVPVLILPMRL